MIGNCTLVVKDKDGSYRVHIIGLTLGEVKPAEFIKLDKKFKNKPDASGLSESDVYQILSSHQCASEHKPHYSKFAGDRKWFLDLSTKSLLDVEEYVKKWEFVHSQKIEQERIEQERILKEKTKQVLENVNADANKFCVELIKFLEGKSELPFTPASYAKDDSDYDRVEFRIGNFSFSKSRHSCNLQCFTPGYSSDYELIRGKFHFEKIFFKHLKNNKWKVTTLEKTDAYTNSSNRTWMAACFAKKGNKTIFQSGEHDLSFVTMKTA